MSAACLMCGARDCRRHHPTGRDYAEQYLDVDLTVSVCHDDHQLLHDDRHTLGSEKVGAPLCWFDRVELRLRRLASDMARMAEAHPQSEWWPRCAALLTRWADEIAAGSRALDARSPGWRADPAFYPNGTIGGA